MGGGSKGHQAGEVTRHLLWQDNQGNSSRTRPRRLSANIGGTTRPLVRLNLHSLRHPQHRSQEESLEIRAPREAPFAVRVRLCYTARIMKIWVPVVLTASLLVSGSGTTRAQAPAATAPTPLTAPTDYPGESFIFDHLTRTYTFAADGTGTREFSGVIEVRNQPGVKAFSVIPFDFASNSEHVEIDYVRVRHADGSIVTTSASDAQELPTEVTREAPFYSDLKQEQIPVRGLQPGVILEFQIRIIRTKSEAPNHFWGNESFFLPSNGIVIRSEVVELHVPKDAYIRSEEHTSEL